MQLEVKKSTGPSAAAKTSTTGSEAKATHAVASSAGAVSLFSRRSFRPRGLDRMLRAATGHVTHGHSPHSMSAAWFDWSSHILCSPERQMALITLAWDEASRLAISPSYIANNAVSENKRFSGEAWKTWSYSAYVDAFKGWET